jgi:hypothetical protein
MSLLLIVSEFTLDKNGPFQRSFGLLRGMALFADAVVFYLESTSIATTFQKKV